MSRSGFRSSALLWATAVLALAWAAVGDRVLTRLAYAVERGRSQAANDELAALHVNQPELAAVSGAFKLVSKLVRPGVVHIRVTGGEDSPASEEELERSLREHMREYLPKDENAPDDAAPDESTAPESEERTKNERELRQQLERWLRQHRLPPGAASGIILDRDGHILTNNHVVGGRTEIKVVLYDEREYGALLVGTDPKTDLAVIKIAAPDLQPLVFGDSDQLEVGDWVLAVGSPFGLQQTVTHGIVSATGRTRIPGVDIYYQNFIQTDAAINPGNSGGPLLSLRGEVVGVNTAIATQGEAVNAGIAFAIPGNRAAKIAQQLKASGAVTRGWLGISFTEIDAADAEIFGLPDERGIFVERVLSGGPAEAAGLQVEDVVIAIDGVPTTGTEQLRGLIADLVPGDQAHLRVVRYGAELSIDVRLGTQPENIRAAGFGRATEAREVGRLGLYLRTFRPSFLRNTALGYKATDRGALVWGLTGEAQRAPDVSQFELIVGCDGKPIKSVQDLQAAVGAVPAGKQVRLEVLEQSGDRRIITVEAARD